MFAEVINARNPIAFHGPLLVLSIFTAIPLDLDNELQGVFMAVVYAYNKVRDIFSILRTITVRYLKAKIMIFDISSYFRMSLCHSTKFCFPVTVQNDPVDVTTICSGFPSMFFDVLKLTWLVVPFGL